MQFSCRYFILFYVREEVSVLVVMNNLMYLFVCFFTQDVSYSDDTWQVPLKTAEVGGRVNLSCIYTTKRITTMTWFRQKFGEKPRVIATSYQLQPPKFYNEFEKSVRFAAEIGPLFFNMSISNLTLSDSATYYCAVIFLYDIAFGEGTVLIVKGKKLYQV